MWEGEDRGRVGLEVYYTGRQRLEVNPYRAESKPYVIVGMLVEKRDGRWTVDAWAPVDGRASNGGVRFGFRGRPGVFWPSRTE